MKDQVKSLAMALPLKSFTPLDPPLIVTVYVVRAASSAVGVRVAVAVAAVYVTLLGIALPEESCMMTVNVLTVEEVIGSLNVAVAEIPRLGSGAVVRRSHRVDCWWSVGIRGREHDIYPVVRRLKRICRKCAN